MNREEVICHWPCPENSANIYRLPELFDQKPNIEPLLKTLNISCPPTDLWEELGDVFNFEQGQHMITLYRPSLAFRYIDVNRWQIDNGKSECKLTDHEAALAAREVLVNCDIFNNNDFELTKVTRLKVSLAQKGSRPIEPKIIDVGVVFSRIIDGFPVYGPGGKVVVYLDGESILTGLEHIARPIAGIHEQVMGWREADDVIDEIESYWEKCLDDTFEVDDVRLGYYEMGRLQNQFFLQPTYTVVLRFKQQENAIRRVEYVAVAAKNGIGSLMPKARDDNNSIVRYDDLTSTT